MYIRPPRVRIAPIGDNIPPGSTTFAPENVRPSLISRLLSRLATAGFQDVKPDGDSHPLESTCLSRHTDPRAQEPLRVGAFERNARQPFRVACEGQM